VDPDCEATMGSDGVLIPVASLGFFRSGRFAHGAAVGLTVGGVVGTLAAFPLVNAIAAHLTLMRWLVIILIIYAAVSMLRSACIPTTHEVSTLTE
jgi:multisubunit Na+/H+ antiporter MnhE subunit